MPTNGLFNFFTEHQTPFFKQGFPSYIIAGFFIPIFYGSWRFTAYHMIFGVYLARATTTNIDEWPAVWCLFSIALLLVVVKTPVRKWLYVKRWILWPKSWVGTPALAAAGPAPETVLQEQVGI